MASIEIFGDDNYVLINDTFKNLIFVEKGVVQFPIPGSASILGCSGQYSYSSASSSPPLLAVNSAFPVFVQTVERSGNTYTWTMLGGPQGRGQSAEVFLFHLPETVPDAGGLVQLFDASGTLVFDSSLKYMKVERNLGFALDSNASISVTSGRKYAAITSNWPGEYGASPYPPLTRPPLYGVAETQTRSGFYMGNGFVATQKFTYLYRTYAVSNPVTNTWRKDSGMLLVLDVTGY